MKEIRAYIFEGKNGGKIEISNFFHQKQVYQWFAGTGYTYRRTVKHCSHCWHISRHTTYIQHLHLHPCQPRVNNSNNSTHHRPRPPPKRKNVESAPLNFPPKKSCQQHESTGQNIGPPNIKIHLPARKRCNRLIR